MQWSITRGGNKSIIASRKFYDNDTIKAVLEMRLDYEKVLSPFMSQITDNTGGMIMDDNGNVVYADCSMDKKYRPKNIENLKDISDKYYISQRTMKDTGWNFYIYRPKAVSENAIHKLLLKNIPLILISVLLLSLLGYVFSIRMVSQLELLTENMNQINMGLRKVTVQSKSKDEVGVLIRSFQRMMDQMNHLISEVYESKIQLQNSEMRALQAQINPHFLYNSLSIINFFCHRSHCFTTIQACPIIGRQCQCYMTDFILPRFNRFPVDDRKRIVKEMWIDLCLQRSHLTILKLDLTLIYF